MSSGPITSPTDMEDLDVLVGTWSLAASLAADGDPPQAEASFEWLEGRRFLIERWHIEHPDAPDGIAVIGPGLTEGSYRQHYFDSRGVERIYEMTLVDGVWMPLARRCAPGFLAALHGDIRPLGRHDRLRLGDRTRRHNVGARLRPHLHADAGMSSELVRTIIDASSYMTLATSDEHGSPWASPVWFATADYRELVWASKPEARHSRNLASRPEVGIVIFDSTAAPGHR